LSLLVRVALAAVLGVAAGAKLRSLGEAADALETFGVPRMLRRPAVIAVVALEAALAVGVAIGSDAAAYAASGLLACFAAALGIALARGRGGAPCGCFGATSRVTGAAVVRNLLLAGALAAVPSLPSGAPSARAWLVIALTAAFACIAVLAVAVLALAREVGLLRLRLAPESALELAEEGPPVGSRIVLPERLAGASQARLAVAIFSSEGCRMCQSLRPVIAAFQRDPLVAVEVFDEVRDAELWRELAIPGSPFAVAFDRGGAVRAKGTFNSYGQLESILATAERRLADARA